MKLLAYQVIEILNRARPTDPTNIEEVVINPSCAVGVKFHGDIAGDLEEDALNLRRANMREAEHLSKARKDLEFARARLKAIKLLRKPTRNFLP